MSAVRGSTHPSARTTEALAVYALTYGPVGDPASRDHFEWAQARMPVGWHVEGQVVTLQRYRGWGHPSPSQPVTWQAMATTAAGDRCVAIGYTVAFALANLVRRVPR